MAEKQLVARTENPTEHMVDQAQTGLAKESGWLAMWAKWNEPTSKTIKVPSIRAVLLVVILLASLVAIVWVSISVQMESPQAAEVPFGSDDTDDPAAWLSAWSTFWGAVAGGVGAIATATAGALWVGAVTFKRQIRDQHRAQASRVIVRIEKGGGGGYLSPRAIVDNLSDLPIYNVRLTAAPRDAFDNGLEKTEPVLVGAWPPVTIPGKYLEDSVNVGLVGVWQRKEARFTRLSERANTDASGMYRRECRK